MAWVIVLAAAQEVEGQPLAANAARVVQAFGLLGAPLAVDLAAAGDDPRKIQAALDPLTAFRVTLGGTAEASPLKLQQAGWTPLLVKVVNPKGIREPLAVASPQSGPVYAGVAALSMKRQGQPALRENENTRGDDRFLQVEPFTDAPMTPRLSGLGVEYAVALVYSSAAGAREAEFSLGGAAVRAALDIRPAVEVKVSVRDVDGAPTTGRFTFRDKAGRIYPPQPKRLAPDFFFQKQIYRAHGETVLLPPGVFTMEASRGPEYRTLTREVAVPGEIDVRLERWVEPGARGFWSGDHHIHAAGCAHYTKPSEGVHPPDMFRQVKGEGLNVGCVLTWGPSFDYQAKFFSPGADPLSEPFTALKYDVEVSGFGSQALGHVCLLNLKDQIYPGAAGAKGWPTWTTPVLTWAKAQGAVVGYAHSASGLQVDAPSAAKRLMEELDADRDGRLTPAEAEKGLLPGAVGTEAEVAAAIDRAADELPNLVIPEMNSVGAMEMFVTVANGACDFMSSMDTARIPEWNAWYHVLNCGFPLKVSGETDFPCMSSTRVGQGRVYVRLGKIERIDYAAWCAGIKAGRSYVSDGYAHALEFAVEGKRPGDAVALAKAGRVKVAAVVAFGAATPAETPYGGLLPLQGRRWIGDTVDLRGEGALRPMERRLVELVVNGRAVASKLVPADDREHALEFEADVERSSWVALRQFPQLHTNPVDVIVDGKPIRASKASALWCAGAIRRLWSVRQGSVAPAERAAADAAFRAACDIYRKIKSESEVQ
ncbi:MAG TPA: CehA/McbA family metallohydrolase [Planctomycetota bacterium]